MSEEQKTVEEEQLEGQLSLLDTLPSEENEEITEKTMPEESVEDVVAEQTQASPEAVQIEEVKEPSKKELRAKKKADKKADKKARRKARRDNRVGVPVWVVLLIALLINGYWYYTVQYRVMPEVDANYEKYEAAITEYKRQISVQDIIWRNREQYWQQEVDKINEKADELQKNYEIIMKDLGFEIDENGNAYKPEQ